ncbi:MULTISPECIES: penicillin-binding protein 1A [unclassified Minwuia]|jgi:penicillin-binding protein 1A|uniref:penicillin-binding protein 1A n=1 Tax=unclassified Minwuia TaxID=2618799 RepID=UPI00247ABA70|nr:MULTISPECIES: penicillin-binding protein 1A [unclassified Minwuia]
MRIVWKIFLWLTALGVLGALAVTGFVAYAFWHFGRELPEHEKLAEYSPAVVTRVHAGDGQLLAEYARERRLFVPIQSTPRRVINAFLAAEDGDFYNHIGVDFRAVARAIVQNLRNLGTGRRPVGASTITQQVAKNFLLTNEVSYERKIKEAILAMRIEKAFDKNHILELYLNEIYLGQGSYGVASAALTYFDKPLNELTVAEAAFLAALPKAPSNYDPYRHHKRAVARRDWVIGRMVVQDMISEETAREALAEPLEARRGRDVNFVKADWFAEEVRRELADRFGEDGLYDGGLSVQTTMDPRLQEIARDALREGLILYDRRHGYRGPLTQLEAMDNWPTRLAAVSPPAGMPEDWQLAVVLAVDRDGAELGLIDKTRVDLPLERLKWARKPLRNGLVGASPEAASDVLAVRDVVLIGPDTEDPDKPQMRQMPRIDGGVVALDPHTGRVLALVGGFAYERSQFNRATQAARQPGSAFKPFVYAAALEHGFTPASLVLDAPFVIDQGGGQGKWKPSNYSNRFYGPSTLRLGIEKSRNLMTVRLAQKVGMDVVSDYSERFRIYDDLPRTLANALGSSEVTLLKLTAAYGMLVNGGRGIRPTIIDRVQDRTGRTIFRHETRDCHTCLVREWQHQPEPLLPDERPRVVGAETAYQMVSMLEGVVRRGTGARIAQVGKPLAGKTGTSNESRDAWFIGFSPDLAVGVFTGFDNPEPLGRQETGSSVAAPIFQTIMAEALADQPGLPFRVPENVRLIRINARTGEPARVGDEQIIWEAFAPGMEPNPRNAPALTGATIQPETATDNITDDTALPIPERRAVGSKATDGVY